MRSRVALCVVALWVGTISFAREVSVTFRVAMSQTHCTVTGLVSRDSAGRATDIPIERPLAVSDSGTTTVAAIDASAAEIKPVTTDCWAEPASLAAETSQVTVALWPAGTIIGKIETGRNVEAPRSVVGTFVDAATDRNRASLAAEHAAYCTIESRTWRCAVPARRPLHLKLALDDYAPVYFWDLDVRETSDTGINTLARGGSLVGRVVGDANRPIENANVRLETVASAHQPAADREIARLRTRSDAKGYFHFVGVPAGRYRITSTSKDRGDASGGIVDLADGQDLRLGEPLLHAALAALEVIISPPMSKKQKRWTVRLRRPGERMGEMVRVAEARAGADGVWTAGTLQPATYVLTILDDQESEVARQEVQLRGGSERLFITIAAITVQGKVLSAEARESTLEFVRAGQRVRVTTDMDGAFVATFPVAGSWLPSLYLGPNAAEVRLPPVEIHSPHEEELLLEVPGGRVYGTVFGPNGQPALAVVTLHRDRTATAECRTGDDGKFELLGLTPGPYTAEAETADGFGRPVTIDVDEKEPTELELRVNGFREVSGTVTGADGSPASGAVVRVFDPVTTAYEETITDGEGSYSFKAKPDAEVVDLIVLAPPHPVALRRIPVGGTRRTISAPPIQLGSAGAKLRVSVERVPPWPVLRAPDGHVYSLVLLIMPQFGYGGIRELVHGAFEFMIEPGAYTVCSNAGECHSAVLAAHAETLISFARTKETGSP